MKARLTQHARRDLVEAARWITRDSEASAFALRRSVADAAHQIATHPSCGVSRPDLTEAPLRFLFLTTFPYVLVYDAEVTPPVIVRVLHAARDLPVALKGPG